MKVVNAGESDQELEMDLQGAPAVARDALGEVLVGQPTDVNSLAEPQRVAPKALRIRDVGSKFSHVFPAGSVSVIRLKTR